MSAFSVKPWKRPPPTNEKLEYAELAHIDLSRFWQGEQAKRDLVDDLRYAVHEIGFWFVTGHGISDDEVLRQCALGQAFLDQDIDEKRKYPCDFANGNYWGYREPVRAINGTEVKENSEAMCIPKVTKAHEGDLPPYEFLLRFKDEIESFQRKVHAKILDPLYRLFAIMLELPEDYFASRFAFDVASEDHLRWMRYKPNPKEVDDKIANVQLAGHTDFGLVTLLFSQSVAGLQLQLPDASWKYVPYVPDGVVVNNADVLSFLTNGYIKSTIHRVVRAPDDQTHVDRLGLFYFARAPHDLELKVVPSPLLKRLGQYPSEETSETVTGKEWTRARVKHSWAGKTYADQEFAKGFEYGGLAVKTLYS